MPEFGAPVADWQVPPAPSGMGLEGAYARLEALDADRHGPMLWPQLAVEPRVFDYLYEGPFATEAAYRAQLARYATDPASAFYAIYDKDSGLWSGIASYLRIAPDAGSIEIGNICLSPVLQRRRAATEALTMMIGWAFDAGYRRLEWKCNALNLPSRRAAERLGLSYEGIFRQAAVVKGRNRDTSWYAAIDGEWPALRAAYAAWLDPANFDAIGQQVRRLADLTAPILATRDPALAETR